MVKKHFRDLEVRQAARTLANQIYDLTEGVMFSRDFALWEQIRRAAISPMSNIAEGLDSGSDKVLRRHLRIAKGSTGEVQSQLTLALDRDYISESQFQATEELIDSLARQLNGFIKYLTSLINNEAIRDP